MPHIYLKTLWGQNFSIDFGHTDTVGSVKQNVKQQHPELCPTGQIIKLLFSGVELEDVRTLADYNVAQCSTLHVVVTALATEDKTPSHVPPPLASRQFEQNVDVKCSFVYCAKGVHGKNGPNCVKGCRFKLRCATCGTEAIELPEGKDMQDLCPTTACLKRCMSSKACIPGTVCYNYFADEHDGVAGCDCGSIFVMCDECHAASYLSECSLLLQVVAARPGETCAVSFMEPDDGKFIQFHPCGHKISLEYFIENAKQEIVSGCASKRLVQSPFTGHVAFVCPMKDELCPKSLVHDLHHYKMLGADETGVLYYDRIKELSIEGLKLAPVKAIGSGNSSIVSQIQEAIYQAHIFQCPYEQDGKTCGAQGVKDGGCMFPSCPLCQNEFCYWCGQASKDHKCPKECGPIFISEAKLSNGMEFNDNSHVALQEYHVWRAKWMLNQLCHEVGKNQFLWAVQENPGIFEDLFADDGTGILGIDGALAGVTIPVGDIIDYMPVTVIDKFSGAQGCDPFPHRCSNRKGCTVS